ncbi:OCIA domain-containing protein 1-like isoform X2 [Hyposmocoma kahamanoa]|uniref:OCIA domain-containing protein 1-like isoform X2 n=1 Tax=Hyposmocoma kahamanoa TaxID=1477025 RepID=UPI000E6DA054|nr:OCIA domain-containing protein 1-like isoform X2 [Hyposmocoma kahamanoa]
MNEPSAFVYEDSGVKVEAPPPPPQPATPFQGPYKFSPDELRVLGECNQESFFQRSLPLGTAMGLGTYFAIQQGHLKANPRFGVIPKVTLAVVMGYFIGKISYQEKCAEKLMALPGSYIGQLLRERKDGKIRGTSLHQQAPSMFGAGPNDIYSDAGPGNSLDLDTDRPIFSDDTYHPDNHGSINESPPEGSARPVLSYDELRRRNRGEYSDSKQNPYRMDPNLAPPITRQPQPQQKPSTNKYGDTME